MVNFYVKSVTAIGKGKTTSTVEFIDGVNIIKGDSDTGKTKVIYSILFAMGATRKPFAAKTGYDKVVLVIGTPGGDIQFERKYSANIIEVVSENSEIEDGKYAVKNSKNNARPLIKDVWLKLIGIEDSPEAAHNKDSDKWAITWNAMMPIWYVDEHEICRETSIIEPVQYTQKTYLLSIILYLIYGKDFAGEAGKKDQAIKEAKREIMEEYLGTKLSNAEAAVKRYKAYYDAITDITLQRELQKTAEDQKRIEEEIAAMLEDGKRIVNESMELELQISEMAMLSNRYNSLQTQYDSDVRRLSFLAEGGKKLAELEPIRNCPYCDHPIEVKKLPSYEMVSKSESKRIRGLQSGLADTQREMTEEKAILEKQLETLNSEYEEIQRKIREELNPRKTEIEKLLADYQEQIDNRNKYKIYEQMRKDIEDELKLYVAEVAAEVPKKAEYKPRECFDAQFRKVMDEYAFKILDEMKYPRLEGAKFNVNTFDVEINGGAKVDDHGKGYCAFINSVLALMVRKYLVEHGEHSPGITIIDSPLHGMFQGVEDDAPESMKSGMFRYLSGLAKEGQLIIAENAEHVPVLDYAGLGVKVIEFKKNDPAVRHGYLWDVYQ